MSHIFLIESPFLQFDETNEKIAAFDYDWTLVKPKGGKTFPSNVDDWEWLRPNVPEVLKKYYNEEYSIYIFSNQSKPWKLDMIKNSLNILNIPIKVVIGWKNALSKPDPLLFNQVIKDFDKKISFYCGDAAGRPMDWSNVDALFANSIGIDFKVPEDEFPISIKIEENVSTYIRNTREIIILVGYPASGKTTFAEEKFKSYTIISGDECKTTEKMIRVAKKYTSNSLVFDATNGKKVNREKIINYANTNDIPVRCFVFDIGIEGAMERNSHRAHTTGKQVPRIAFYTYRKYYEEPSLEEGYSEIIRI